MTNISPFPSVAPFTLCISTLVPSKFEERVAPVISPPLAAMVKSFGSISHLSALTLKSSDIFTLSPEVSTNPSTALIFPDISAVPP